jgi:secondary thiamine-phosphate synthase enzyme
VKFHIKNISVKTDKKLQILDVTRDVSKIVGESGISEGLANLWVPHSTAAVAVNEHDTDLWEDILSAMGRLVPVKGDYRHNAKYGWSSREQNAHAHILNCMINSDVNIPIQGGRLQLGTWQSILFIELDGPRSRSIRIQVMGE